MAGRVFSCWATTFGSVSSMWTRHWPSSILPAQEGPPGRTRTCDHRIRRPPRAVMMCPSGCRNMPNALVRGLLTCRRLTGSDGRLSRVRAHERAHAGGATMQLIRGRRAGQTVCGCGCRPGRAAQIEDTRCGQRWVCADCIVERRYVQVRSAVQTLENMQSLEREHADDSQLDFEQRSLADGVARGIALALAVLHDRLGARS